jgi:hypothetical protein
MRPVQVLPKRLVVLSPPAEESNSATPKPKFRLLVNPPASRTTSSTSQVHAAPSTPVASSSTDNTNARLKKAQRGETQLKIDEATLRVGKG